MTLRARFGIFFEDDAGAVTSEWVFVSAAIAIVGTVVVYMIAVGSIDVISVISEELKKIIVALQ